ncbi:MAG: Ig-like domain-containing protein [Chloroherpetonaceae bacterium]|nr:Ig-like domain-containing protein [Chloroherpetonaceae bacterium]MDW8437650.1 Ig-like domain-containing protein [Chloroherpetonaceae bacterium]
MNGLRIALFVWLFFASFMFQRCAVDIAPTGGPEDKTPPRIVDVFPDSNATNVRSNALRLRFDKYIVPQTLRNALFFSPRIEDFDIESDGKEAEIILNEPLKPNRTYACTITKALTDTRGNALAQSVTFAFSTGAQIDSGAISGVVYSADNRLAKGATVFAYFIPPNDSLFADTLNPRRAQPDYIAQTGEDGRFQLSFLKTGAYRLFAAIDKNQNLLLDAGEPFAVPFDSVCTGKSDVRLRLAERDTTRIELQSANAYTSHRVALRFDRNALADSLTIENFAIIDSLAKKPIRLYDFYVAPEGNRELIYLVCDSLVKGRVYGVQAFNVQDAFGNRADTLVASLVGISEPDTARAQIQLPFADSAKGVLEREPPSPRGRRLPIEFSLPIQRASLARAIHLLKGNDTLELDFLFRDARRAELKPKGDFEAGAWHRLVVNHAEILDALGRKTLDTLIRLNFQIAGKDLFGEIEGELVVDSVFQSFSRVALVAELVGEKKFFPQLLQKSPSDKTLAFKFSNLPEGKYFLSGFLLRDSTNASPFRAWDGGSVKPFRPSEPFFISLDSLRVRKRWTTDGVQLRLE